jgi:hypothetical protein
MQLWKPQSVDSNNSLSICKLTLCGYFPKRKNAKKCNDNTIHLVPNNNI